MRERSGFGERGGGGEGQEVPPRSSFSFGSLGPESHTNPVSSPVPAQAAEPRRRRNFLICGLLLFGAGDTAAAGRGGALRGHGAEVERKKKKKKKKKERKKERKKE